MATKLAPLAVVTPAFDHDCAACRFLGRFAHGGQEHDLYLCPNDASLIARYGSEDAHNRSMGLDVGEDALSHSPLYAEIIRRAKAAGLIA